MTKDLTIGIPTANRPESLRACLESIKKFIDFPIEIIIVDSSNEDLRYKPDNEFDDIKVIVPVEMLSPSHARKVIAERCKTSLLLFLDDDMTVSENAVQTLVDYLKRNDDIDIVGGAVNEYGYWREIGFSFQIGEIRGSRVVVKNPIRKEWLDQKSFEAFRVDFITQPPFLMRTEIFKRVNFDENYLWASEIIDFFFQCYQNGYSSVVIPSAVFNHFPTKYTNTTYKHDKKSHNREGKDYFYEKWNTKIHNLQRRKLIVDFIEEWKYRRDKKRRVKKKIVLDDVEY